VSRFTDEKQNPTGGDLISTTSPGGFFFLDRNRQIEEGNAAPLEGEWWGDFAFGEAPSGSTGGPPGGSTGGPAEPSTVVANVDATTTDSLAAMAGRWEGEAVDPSGFRFKVELEVTEGCAMNTPCGKIAVPHVPCRGDISLIDSREEGYEFNVDRFDASSDPSICTPGAGEVFRPLPDGTLHYTATYSGATGLLRRQ
jgi:hypothetical protein